MLRLPLGDNSAGLALSGHAVPDPQSGCWPGQGRVAGGNGPQIRLDLLLLVDPTMPPRTWEFALEFAARRVASIVWLSGRGSAPLSVSAGARRCGQVLSSAICWSTTIPSSPFGSADGQSFGNLLEIVICAALLRRLISRDRPLWSIPGLAVMLGAIAAGTAISATIGSVSVILGGVVDRRLLCTPVANVVALATSAARCSCSRSCLPGCRYRSGPGSGSLHRARGPDRGARGAGFITIHAAVRSATWRSRH